MTMVADPDDYAAERLAMERFLSALTYSAHQPIQVLRAPVIVAGAVILERILRRYGLEEIEASERDLLDGVALEAAKLPEPVEGEAPPGAYVCC
jgi:exopolyphosphatase/guanosine-5'-triphosphate,3'-diphosphate pyrophosphatase